MFNHQDQISTNGHGQPLRASAQNPTRGASLISQLLGFCPTRRQQSFDTTFQGTFTQSAVRGHGACCTKVQIGCFNSDLPAFGFKVWQSHTFTKWFATPLKEVRSQIAHGQLWLWFASTEERYISQSSLTLLLLWAMAVVPIAGPKCGSKGASRVHQQPAHGYMVLLIPAT